MLETIIGAAGGGAGLICFIVLKWGPRFLMELAVGVTAFRRDPTVHNRLRKSLKDIRAGKSLTGVRVKK
jgi:hypothetical protein